MTPAEVAAKLRAFNEWRRGDEDIPQLDPREIGEVIDAAVEMIERLAALPARITPNQAPAELRKYWPIAAQCYAQGWNDCIKAAAPKPEGSK